MLRIYDRWQRSLTRPLLIICIGFLAVLAMAGCANIGNPSGGPRDEDPPILVRANPPQGTLNVTKPDITLTFNELINVKDAFDRVVVSPSGRPPRVSSQGKNVLVRFDSLAPNTTYTVDFADAIEDNNEGNKLQNFAYTFSTGPSLDTLRISGRVLGSRDLEPRPGIIVGVTDNTTDSVFLRTPLLRVAKTDDRGRFIIRGLAPGNYRVMALKDANSDFMYSSADEEVAFYPLTVSPSTRQVGARDTVYNKLTGAIDTVLDRQRTQYLPNDLLLRTFLSSERTQYVSRYERNDSNRLFLKMNAPSAQLPPLRILGHEDKFPGIIETREGNDSITVWLPTPLARQDSVLMTVSYVRNEWNKAPVDVTDTLKFIRKKLPVPKKKKAPKLSRRDSIALVTTTLTLTTQPPQEVWRPAIIESKTPLARLDTAAIRLLVLKDSIWRDAPKGLRVFSPDSLQPRNIGIDYPWEYGATYRLQVDSLAGTDIYGRPTLPLTSELRVRPASDYCTLTLNVTGLEQGLPAFVELLDASDKVARTAAVENGRAFFPFLQSGKYYARIIEDYNGNGLYDPGNFKAGTQPDLAYYYPKPINIKKNWDKEETWDIWATAIDMQKPAAILKNKPKTSKHNRNNDKNQEEYDEEDEPFDPTANPFEQNNRRNNRNNNNRRTGGGFRQNNMNF